jgi:hypothetical protein
MINRIIYTAEAPTPQPCCPKQLKTLGDATVAYLANVELIFANNQKVESNQADINWTTNALSNYETAIKEKNNEWFDESAKLNKNLVTLRSFERQVDYNPLNYNARVSVEIYEDLFKQSQSKIKAIDAYLANLDLNKKRLNKNLEEFNKIKKELLGIQTKLLDIRKVLRPALKAAQDAYDSCKKGCEGAFHVNLSLNLKSSCKEIKQKIKTLNQKLTSSKNKNLDLKYGLNNLHILNINKKLYDEKIKITTEFLEKLDKLRPYIPETLTIFFTFYNEAKANSASYQMESNTLANKIKISKEKAKTISEKKKRLKPKISSLLKQFKKCLKA